MTPARRLVPLLLVAISAAGAAAVPADAALRAHDFESALPARASATTRTAHAALAARGGGWITLPARAAPRTFNMIGLRWRGAPVAAQARVRRPGHPWSAWLALDAVGSGRGGMTVTEPLWSSPARRYQVRFSHPVSGTRVHFVRVDGHAPARAHAASSRAAAPGSAPAIIPRSTWNPGDECAPRAAPLYGRVDLAFVHDTVTANDYSPQDSAGIVLAICRYHRNSNGWNDIGYNFLVDKYGQVFEGRAGGIDRAVVGAQAQGYNSFSTGISNIGTYDKVRLPAVAVQSLSRLIAWKLTQSGVPTQGKIREVTGGGTLNRYAAGTAVTLNRIAGHRDGDATDCPGNALYAQLPQIRALASGLAGQVQLHASLSATAATRTVEYPAPAELSGVLTLADGTHARGTNVLIQRQSGGHWITLDSAPVGGDGAWQAQVPLTWGHVLRAYWPGDATHKAVKSGGRKFTVVPSLNLHVAHGRVRVKRSVVLSGHVAPHKRHLRLTVVRGAHGHYRTVAVRGLSTHDGSYRMSFLLTKRTLYRFTVSFAGDAHNPSTSAPSVFVRALSAKS